MFTCANIFALGCDAVLNTTIIIIIIKIILMITLMIIIIILPLFQRDKN